MEYPDTKINENDFVRNIDNNSYYYSNGTLTLTEGIKKAKFITPRKTSDKINFFPHFKVSKSK